MDKIKEFLKELGFNGNEIKVYIALTQLGESVASVIAKKSGLPRTTVISILEKMETKYFISTHRYKGVSHYWIESPSMLKEDLEKKSVIADELNELLSGLYRSEADFPGAKVYDTKAKIKSFIEKTMRSIEKRSTIYTFDTPAMGHYTKIYSDEYSDIIRGIKKKRDVLTKTLVPHGSISTIRPVKLASQKIEVKELPPEVGFTASFWIIKDTLVLFSGKYPFIIAVRHKIITQSMKSIFDFFWKLKKE